MPKLMLSRTTEKDGFLVSENDYVAFVFTHFKICYNLII